MNEKIKKQKVENYEVVGEIELPTFDVGKYIGVKTEIAGSEVFNGDYGYYLLVSSKLIDVLGKGKNAIDVKATRMFSLLTDENGKICWGDKSKLALFLKEHSVKTFSELVGKKIIAITREGKDGKKYLTF